MKIEYTANAPEDINRESFQLTINQICADSNYSFSMLSYVFLSDEELLEMNNRHLGHDYYTDIITFDLSDTTNELSGELYISLDRVRDNASKLGVDYTNELIRVMIHGVLHLVGFNDSKEDEKKIIRLKEDHYLNLYA